MTFPYRHPPTFRTPTCSIPLFRTCTPPPPTTPGTSLSCKVWVHHNGPNRSLDVEVIKRGPHKFRPPPFPPFSEGSSSSSRTFLGFPFSIVKAFPDPGIIAKWISTCRPHCRPHTALEAPTLPFGWQNSAPSKIYRIQTQCFGEARGGCTSFLLIEKRKKVFPVIFHWD